MPTQQESVHVLQVITGLSNVIGAVDGTHIRIKSPPNDQHLFVKRGKKATIQSMFMGCVIANLDS